MNTSPDILQSQNTSEKRLFTNLGILTFGIAGLEAGIISGIVGGIIGGVAGRVIDNQR